MLDSLILLYSKTDYKESLEQKGLSKPKDPFYAMTFSGAFRPTVF